MKLTIPKHDKNKGSVVVLDPMAEGQELHYQENKNNVEFLEWLKEKNKPNTFFSFSEYETRDRPDLVFERCDKTVDIFDDATD